MDSDTNGVNEHEAKLSVLERRLAAVEKKLSLIESSRLGGELRMMELGQRQRALDIDAERRRERERKAAAPDRADVFRRFARERLTVHAELAVTQRELFVQYNRWAVANEVPLLHRLESLAELHAAVETAFPDTEGLKPADVCPPRYMGKHPPHVPGYVGIGLVAEGEDPAEVARALSAEAARDAAQREARNRRHQFDASVEAAVINTLRVRDEAARAAVEAARK